jgi:hypothetical protein
MRQIWLLTKSQKKLGNGYYCDEKLVSHFREIAKTCQEEGFELIEDKIN